MAVDLWPAPRAERMSAAGLNKRDQQLAAEINASAGSVKFDKFAEGKLTVLGFDLQNIPQTHYMLYLHLVLRASGAATLLNVRLRLNADSATKFFYILEKHDGSVATLGETLTSQQGAQFNGAIGDGVSDADRFSVLELYIPDYASTTMFKNVYVRGAGIPNGLISAATIQVGVAKLSTTAVTRLLLDNATYDVRSRYALYGIGDAIP
jgi:hypothetical protein